MNVRTCTRCGSDFLGLAAPGSGSLCPKCRLVAAHPGAPAAAHEAPPAIPRALPSASAPRPVPTPRRCCSSFCASAGGQNSSPLDEPGRRARVGCSARAPDHRAFCLDGAVHRSRRFRLRLLVAPYPPSRAALKYALAVSPRPWHLRLPRKASSIPVHWWGRVGPTASLWGSPRCRVRWQPAWSSDETTISPAISSSRSGLPAATRGTAYSSTRRAREPEPPARRRSSAAKPRAGEFLIIADSSGSMEGTKFERVVAEITATVKGLKSGAKFYVIFYDDSATPYPETRWLSGRRDIASLEHWMAGLDPGGLTNPLPAFQIAFTRVHPRPDAIFFMTDGLFGPAVAGVIPALNSAQGRPDSLDLVC